VSSRKAFRILASAYPNFAARFDDIESVEEWCSLLADIDECRLVEAVRHLAKTSRHVPAVAEIREQAGAGAGNRPPEVVEIR
jgi:hypothetical protein